MASMSKMPRANLKRFASSTSPTNNFIAASVKSGVHAIGPFARKPPARAR